MKLNEMDSRKFRVGLNMSHFFHDHRSSAYILISNNMNTILDLENKISEIFGIDSFYLACQDKYLPTKEDIGLIDKEDVVWVIPKSLPNLERTKAYKKEKRKERRDRRQSEIEDCNNIIFSTEELVNSNLPKHKTKQCEGKSSEPKKKKQSTEVSDLSHMASTNNEEIHLENKTKKAKRKKHLMEIDNTSKMIIDDSSPNLKTIRKELSILNIEFIDNSSLACKDKKKKQKKRELNSDNTNNMSVHVISNNNSITNENKLARPKNNEDTNGNKGKIPANGSTIECSLSEHTNNNYNTTYKNKERKDHLNTDFSDLKDSHILSTDNRQLEHNKCEIQKDNKKENETKAIISSLYVIKPNGNVHQQSTPLGKKETKADVFQNTPSYNGYNNSPTISLARLLSDLRSQTPNSFISTEESGPIKRKRVRKRQRKSKEKVEYKVHPAVVVAQKPLIIPVKPSIHIKFDTDSNEEDCSAQQVQLERNGNINPASKYLVNPIQFVPASKTDECNKLLNGSMQATSEIQEMSKRSGIEEASKIDALEVPAKEMQKSLIGASSKPSEKTNNVVHNTAESVKKENDLLICKKPNLSTVPDNAVELSKEITVETPDVGSTICFKIFRLNADYNPEISSNIVGNVQYYDCNTNKIILKILDGLDQCVCPTGKFYMDLDAEDVQGEPDIKEFDWPELLEPKLYVLSQSKDS